MGRTKNMPSPAAFPTTRSITMSENTPAHTKHRLARIYGAGIAAFIAAFGFLSRLVWFLTSLN